MLENSSYLEKETNIKQLLKTIISFITISYELHENAIEINCEVCDKNINVHSATHNCVECFESMCLVHVNSHRLHKKTSNHTVIEYIKKINEIYRFGIMWDKTKKNVILFNFNNSTYYRIVHISKELNLYMINEIIMNSLKKYSTAKKIDIYINDDSPIPIEQVEYSCMNSSIEHLV